MFIVIKSVKNMEVLTSNIQLCNKHEVLALEKKKIHLFDWQSVREGWIKEGKEDEEKEGPTIC